MAVLADLTEEEKYLFSILQDQSGIDQAEFSWTDETSKDFVFRCWDFQYPWYRNKSKFQIDQCARAIGKSVGIQMRAWAFAFTNPGEEMLITAPEMIHLDPVTKNIEDRIMSARMSREFLKKQGTSNGITHRPFEAKFRNGASIKGRIPQKDGKGVKGMHPKKLEMDEAQDYPEPGWVELGETLKYGEEDATWRSHGVSRGVRDRYYKQTQPESGWHVHRLCVPEGTLVYGVDGPFEIQEAQPGAMVWAAAPDGSLVQRPVLAAINNGIKATWKVSAKGGYGLETTPNHPYLVLNRAGTRRTRRALEFEWVEAQDVRPGDYIIGVRELESTGVRIPSPDEITTMLRDHSPVREVPAWVWNAPRALQLGFLGGYLMGDGSLSHQKRGQDPWQVATASLRMAKQIRALCHYLGLRTTNLKSKIQKRGLKPGEQMLMHGFYVYADEAWFSQIPLSYSAVRDGQALEGLDKRLVARRVESSASSGRAVATYDITVEEHHNYIAEGVVVHNTAMHRPDWTEQEREAKAELYGSRDHPDFRRNILGLHGDASSVLFVLTRLMQCVDQEKNSFYNTDEYAHIRISEEKLNDSKMPIQELLEFPALHKQYERVWVGMDVGLTNHPSEILIFAEEYPQSKTGGRKEDVPDVRLKCIARVHLERISSPDQRRVLEAIWDFYHPQGIAMDRTGLGLPIWQEIAEYAPRGMVKAMRPYNFSEKIVVGYEEEDDDEDYAIAYDKDELEKREIKANVLEYSSDMLRLLVDQKQIRLPWDVDMIREFQGQTYVVAKSNTNPYGKKQFNMGKFHALDAARMAILGFLQERIENMKEVVNDEPVFDAFLL